LRIYFYFKIYKINGVKNMKLVELKCKNCGSLLNVEEGEKEITC